MDAEQYGTTLLRDMKHSLTVKRQVKAKLVSYQNDEPKQIGCHTRMWYSIAMVCMYVLPIFRSHLLAETERVNSNWNGAMHRQALNFDYFRAQTL